MEEEWAPLPEPQRLDGKEGVMLGLMGLQHGGCLREREATAVQVRGR